MKSTYVYPSMTAPVQKTLEKTTALTTNRYKKQTKTQRLNIKECRIDRIDRI